MADRTFWQELTTHGALVAFVHSPRPVVDVQHSSVRFLGSLVLNLWDCGGQDAFYESYFASRREHVFSNVAVLIYVFDITSGDVEVRERNAIRPGACRAVSVPLVVRLGGSGCTFQQRCL